MFTRSRRTEAPVVSAAVELEELRLELCSAGLRVIALRRENAELRGELQRQKARISEAVGLGLAESRRAAVAEMETERVAGAMVDDAIRHFETDER